ncbi:hypothetical protein [Acinetobacter sp. BSP-53]|uniref:hypothetical protein n=1 Tax=Acinetobacter sp. BSP-53 TaxID=3344662 RepID=UPI00376F7B43
MTNEITFELVQKYVELTSFIQDVNSTGRRSIEGIIQPCDFARVQEILNDLVNKLGLLDSFIPDFDCDDGQITIDFPSFYYESLEILLREQPLFRSSLPDQIIYFKNENFIYVPKSPNNEKNINIKKYIDCVELYNLLKTSSDHISKSIIDEESLFFLGKRRLEVVNNLSIKDDIKIDKLNAFRSNFYEIEIHKDPIKQIISDSLINYFNHDKKISINNITTNFDNIFEVINNNYNMYLSEFTFEKIKKEVEKFRTESITRLNKAFTDIQMQIITIPASLIVVASSLKTGKDFSILANSIILMGAIFFAIAVLFMCENQKDTLDNIKYEINAQEKTFSSDPLFADKKEITSNFIILNNRYERQVQNIFIVKLSIIFSIIIMCSIYFYYNFLNSCLTVNLPFLEKLICT